MIRLYAQPYDISASGFYFETAEEFTEASSALRNEYGDPIEEFEIQLIDAEAIDCDLAKAWELNQANYAQYLEKADQWDEYSKKQFILAVGECGCDFNPDCADPSDYEVDLHICDTMRELAIEFVAQGYFGEVPEHLQNYIDYDAIARDLSIDYSEAVVAGERLIFRCA